MPPGAAAVLGARKLTEARSERARSQEIFQRLFETGMTIGQAILEDKQALAEVEHASVLEVLVGWNLLGDPTFSVNPEGALSALIFADGFDSGDTSARQ